jgi:alkanesulfonate monooxygenase SsuD/methylene tetrahydromethanopterin reductase-like flavin-dependent oxidoreductase (luciferase family)
VPDLGRPLEFGISVTPYATELEYIRAAVHAAEEAGLQLIGIQDHPYQRRFLDTMSLLGTLIGETQRIRFFPDVASLPMRPPPILAKEAASLDVLSGGRFELGLGAGAFWDAIVAMGGPRRTPGEAVAALEEAIAIMRQAWSGDSVRLRGAHYVVDGYRPGPPPAHLIEIWIGAVKPRMLNLIGRIADGWIPSFGRTDVSSLNEGQQIIDEAARQAGRDPRTIRRLMNVGGTIGNPPEAAGLTGSVDDWIALVADWATEIGIDTFILWPATNDLDQIEKFGRAVAPAVRAEVSRRRDSRSAATRQ